jgi:hypothetical protein
MSAALARRRQRARWAVAPHAERLPLGEQDAAPRSGCRPTTLRTARPTLRTPRRITEGAASYLWSAWCLRSIRRTKRRLLGGAVTATNPPPGWARRRARALRRAATRAPHRVWPGGPVDQAALSPSTVEHVLGSSSQALTRLVRAHPRGRRFSCPRSDFSRALACGAACAAGPAAAPGTAAPGTAAPGTAAPGTAAPGTESPGIAAPGIAPRLIRDNRTVCQPRSIDVMLATGNTGPAGSLSDTRRQYATSAPADRLRPGGLQALPGSNGPSVVGRSRHDAVGPLWAL